MPIAALKNLNIAAMIAAQNHTGSTGDNVLDPCLPATSARCRRDGLCIRGPIEKFPHNEKADAALVLSSRRWASDVGAER